MSCIHLADRKMNHYGLKEYAYKIHSFRLWNMQHDILRSTAATKNFHLAEESVRFKDDKFLCDELAIAAMNLY
jgi:hypothetical protein